MSTTENVNQKEYEERHGRRHRKTVDLVKQFVSKDQKILDLGIDNPLSRDLRSLGFDVMNTGGEDLDINQAAVETQEHQVLTAFEILEHMANPFDVLRKSGAEMFIGTVPLNMWFAKAYWNDEDPWDCHFHEFEPREFDWLLNKAGWTIIHRVKWINPPRSIGFRALLRFITPRHYAVVAKRN